MISEAKISLESNKVMNEILDKLPSKPTKAEFKAALNAVIPHWMLVMHKRIDRFRTESTQLYEQMWGNSKDPGFVEMLKLRDREIKELRSEVRRLRGCMALGEPNLEQAS